MRWYFLVTEPGIPGRPIYQIPTRDLVECVMFNSLTLIDPGPTNATISDCMEQIKIELHIRASGWRET